MSDKSKTTISDLRDAGIINEPHAAGAHFKLFLQRKGLTAAGAARDLGVAKSTMTRWINGQSELSVDLAAKIRQTYNLPVDVFFQLEADYKAYQVEQRIEQSVA